MAHKDSKLQYNNRMKKKHRNNHNLENNRNVLNKIDSILSNHKTRKNTRGV